MRYKFQSCAQCTSYRACAANGIWNSVPSGFQQHHMYDRILICMAMVHIMSVFHWWIPVSGVDCSAFFYFKESAEGEEPLKVIIWGERGKKERNLMEGDTLSSYPDLKRIGQKVKFLSNTFFLDTFSLSWKLFHWVKWNTEKTWKNYCQTNASF